jgi:hypothetical protein
VVIGYPPCPHLQTFLDFIPAKYGLEVVAGTHPMPQDYYLTHSKMGTFASAEAQKLIEEVLTDEETRLQYD